MAAPGGILRGGVPPPATGAPPPRVPPAADGYQGPLPPHRMPPGFPNVKAPAPQPGAPLPGGATLADAALASGMGGLMSTPGADASPGVRNFARPLRLCSFDQVPFEELPMVTTQAGAGKLTYEVAVSHAIFQTAAERKQLQEHVDAQIARGAEDMDDTQDPSNVVSTLAAVAAEYANGWSYGDCTGAPRLHEKSWGRRLSSFEKAAGKIKRDGERTLPTAGLPMGSPASTSRFGTPACPTRHAPPWSAW